MGCVAGRPLARSGVHRVFGQVFSFCPDVFSFRPNVSTLRPDVSTFSRQPPQMCPLGPRMCSPGTLTGDPSRPGPPGWSGSDFGGCAALGTRRATARGPGRRPTLSDLPFRDLCVTRVGCPEDPHPNPLPQGEGAKAAALSRTLGDLQRSPFSGSGEGVPWSSMIGAGDGPGVTGGRPGVRRGLRRGPGGRTGGRGRCGGTGRCRP